jgi:NH3-dependent NAD+ synthetase
MIPPSLHDSTPLHNKGGIIVDLYSTGIFDLIDRRSDEFKLFKRVVRARVSPELWQQICDEYNFQLDAKRNTLDKPSE